MVFPRFAEADVRKTDTAPGEERRQPGQRQQPVKHGRPVGIEIDVRETAKEQNGNDAEQWAAGAVNVRKDLGRVALLGEGGEGATAAVDARHANGDDGDEDDDVHEGIEALEPGVLADEDKGGGIHVGVRVGAEQVRVVRGDEQADKEEAEDVEEGDAPKHLLDGARERFDGVGGLGGCEADELGAGKGKGGGDKDGAKAAKAEAECARVVPQAGAPVLAVLAGAGPAAEDEHEGDDDEDDGGDELEGRGPELFLCVAERAKDVDDDDEAEEHGDPDGDGDVGVPVLHGETANSELEREHNGPLEDVIPTLGRETQKGQFVGFWALREERCCV